MNSRGRRTQRRAADRRALKEVRAADRKVMAVPEHIKALVRLASED
jgi:hypothetical protein